VVKIAEVKSISVIKVKNIIPWFYLAAGISFVQLREKIFMI